MTIASLKKQTKQYASDDQTITELRQKKADAETALTELENDTATDIDKLADLASEHNATISDCTFRLNALNKRHALHRTEILALVGQQKENHQKHERDIRKQRSALAKEFIKSEEFQQVIEKLKGLYAAGGYFSFDSLLSDAIPHHCDYADSKAIAVKHGMWIEEKDIDPAITEAEQAIDIDREQRLFHEQFANPFASNSRLVLSGAA